MGSYSATQGFYEPGADEFVDVESQLNYNLRRADDRVRQLIEWQYVPSNYKTIPDAYPVREVGMKYYKAYSNCPQYTTTTNGKLTLGQDSNSIVFSWSSSGISFQGGYQSENTAEQLISYRRDLVTNTVHWRGGLKLNASADDIPLNTNITVMTIPSNVRPTRGKYFYVHMGFATGNFACCRVLFQPGGTVEINKMGIAQTDSTQRAVSFNDISYPIGDV